MSPPTTPESDSSVVAAVDPTGRVAALLSQVAPGVLVGVVAGMAVFLYTRAPVLPDFAAAWWGLALVTAFGGFAHLLSRTLSGSVRTALVAFAVGFLFNVAAWVAPLWLLSYPPGARDLLLPRVVGRAVTAGILVYPLAFFGGYFVLVVLDGYFDI